MSSANLSDKVFAFTQENALFFAPCHLLVAVSGGPDSMALLNALMHWPQDGLHLSVVHMNHGLRPSAQDDEVFLRRFCEENNLQLTVYNENVADYAKQNALSVEEAGRELRYQRFEMLRQTLGADWIITAHTASDQAETMLMHLIRGCGLDALCGIPVKRDRICRPLLSCNREEVLSYCREHQIPYITDETNQDLRYTRNRMRHEVLPLLREINPSVDSALLRLCHHITNDVQWLDTMAQNLYNSVLRENGYDATQLAAASESMRRRAIRLILRQHQLRTIEEAHILAIEHLVIQGRGKTLLPNRFVAKVSRDVLEVCHEEEDKSAETFCFQISKFPFEISNGKHDYVITLLEKPFDKNIHNLFANWAIDYDTIQGTLQVRSRQAGDSLRPAGRGISKSIKKLMNEWGVPVDKRNDLPLLCDEQGVLLVTGYDCDQRAAVTAQTKRVLIIRQQ